MAGINLISAISRLQDLIDNGEIKGIDWCKSSTNGTQAAAIKTDGTLWTWGNNSQGALGDGTTLARSSPGTVWGGGTDWCSVDHGCLITVAIKCDGTIWTWGANTSGKLGDGTTVSRCSPGTIWGNDTTWCLVSAYRNHISAIKTDGTLWTWGCNISGQLGDGTTASRSSPGTTWGSFTNWFRVSSGYSNVAAIKCDGTLWTWGANTQGRLGNNSTISRCSPGTVAGGDTNWLCVNTAVPSIAIKCDGTLWTWGNNAQGQLGDGTIVNRSSPGTVAGGGTNWCIATLGNIQSAAIKCDGTLWTWGCNYCGSLGTGTPSTLGNRCSPGTVSGGGTNWCFVSFRNDDVAAIKTDGTLWTWGNNNTGQLGNKTTITTKCTPTQICQTITAEDVLLISSTIAKSTDNRQISVGSTYELPNLYDEKLPNGTIVFSRDLLVPFISNNECWLGLDGRLFRSDTPTRCLYTWGCNSQGELGDGTTVSRCSPGTVADGGTTWCFISASFSSTNAIKADGTLWTWGNNCCGALGNNSTVSRSSPGTVAGGGTTWCDISSGSGHSLAIKTDGTLWVWGCDICGQLGRITTTTISSPGTVAGGGTIWCQVAASASTSAAIKTDGTLWTWGCGGCGILGNGLTVARCSPGTVSGDDGTWCQTSNGFILASAIKTDGTLWTWGAGSCGRLGNGVITDRCSPGTVWGNGTNWCKVSSSCFGGMAIKTDGTIWTWGCNFCGRLGDGTTVNRCSPGTVWGGSTTWCDVSTGNNGISMAIKSDGTIWTWGLNGQGRLGDGTTVDRCSPGTIWGGGTNWCTIFASSSHAMALEVQ